MKELEQEIILNNQLDIIDEETMKLTYGDNYQELIRQGQNGSMARDEITALNEKTKENNPVCRSQMCVIENQYIQAIKNGTGILDLNDTTFTIKNFYQKEKSRNLLNDLFYRSDHDGISDAYRWDVLYHKEDQLIGADEKTSFVPVYFLYGIKEHDQKMIDWLNEKYLHAPDYIGSNIGANLLVDHLSTGTNLSLYSILILILVLTSKLFSIDHECETENILFCSKMGIKKLMTAKMITALLIGSGLMIFYILMAYLTVLWIVPIQDLDCVYLAPFYSAPYLFEGVYTYKEILLNQILLLIMAANAVAILSGAWSYILSNRVYGLLMTLFCLVFLTYIRSFISPVIMIYTKGFLSWNQIFPNGTNLSRIGSMIVQNSWLACGSWMIIIGFIYVLVLQKYKRHSERKS